LAATVGYGFTVGERDKTKAARRLLVPASAGPTLVLQKNQVVDFILFALTKV